VKRTSPIQAAREAKRALSRMSRPHGAFDASRYFRATDDIGFHNVGTPAVRALGREIARAHRKSWSLADALVFSERLMADRHLEAKGLAVEVLAAYRREFTPRLLAVWKGWLAAGYASNWATTDDMCGNLIGPLAAAHPTLVPVVALWRSHKSLWVRRASAVGLLVSIRSGRAQKEAYAVARALHADEHDLIQKAVGWMLREAGKVDPKRLERYLRANGPRIPRMTVRYAIERFSTAKRRDLLRATR
jgi:3-methyladenine DNA glycosylase AlkD